MVDYTNVSTRAMLVSLRVSKWSARKFDRKASEEITDSASAERTAGRFNKHLLAGAAAHKAAIDAGSHARTTHYDQTLPWADEGWRLLPTANFESYTDAMRKERVNFDRAADALVVEYPALRAQARAKLGTLYKDEDFPTAKVVRSRFAWAIEFAPVPSAGDIRLDLPAEQLAKIEESITNRSELAAKSAMEAAWERLTEVVARIKRASGPDGIVRGTLIDNARDVCDVLARLNVSDDADLERLRSRVEKELTSVFVDDLRTDDALRVDTERRATEIMSAMSAFYTPPADAPYLKIKERP